MEKFIGLAIACFRRKDEVGCKDENNIPTKYDTIELAHQEIADIMQEYWRQVSDGERSFDEMIDQDEYYICTYVKKADDKYIAYMMSEKPEDITSETFLFEYNPKEDEYKW